MHFINLEQGSPQWLDLRLSKITGTDASVIAGSNPFTSIEELWELKLLIREPKPANERMARGNALEGPARLLLSKELGIDFQPAVVLHDTESWAMASLDGLSPCKRFMCEIKSPGLKNHELAMIGEIAPYYYTQIQHCLYVTGCELCYFASYNPDHREPLIIIKFVPNEEYIEELIAKEKYFYEINMCTMHSPGWTLQLKK